MTTQLIQMNGNDFVKKILAGERNFSDIALERGFDLSGYEGFIELQKYLKKQPLQNNPLILNGSDLSFIIARGIYLPYVIGKKANLGGANLWAANLERANLERANLREANLRRAYLLGANLEKANLGEAYLWAANLERANLWAANLERANLRVAYLLGANLRRANLRNVENLEHALGLENARYGGTIVTRREKESIEKQALLKGVSLEETLFVVE